MGLREEEIIHGSIARTPVHQAARLEPVGLIAPARQRGHEELAGRSRDVRISTDHLDAEGWPITIDRAGSPLEGLASCPSTWHLMNVMGRAGAGRRESTVRN